MREEDLMARRILSFFLGRNGMRWCEEFFYGYPRDGFSAGAGWGHVERSSEDWREELLLAKKGRGRMRLRSLFFQFPSPKKFFNLYGETRALLEKRKWPAKI